MKRRGVQPRDHARDNVVALREAQRLNRLRKETEENAGQAQDGFKMARFRNKESKFMTEAEQAGAGVDKQPFLKRQSMAGPPPRAIAPVRQRTPQKPAVPSAAECVAEAKARRVQREGSERNFIQTNAREAIRSRRTPQREDTEEKRRQEKFGKVPDYIIQRKLEAERQAAAEEAAAQRARGCPPGMMVMDDDERKETLAALHVSMQEVKAAAQRLPLVCETRGQIKRKEAVEEKMKELEDAIKIFSRPKVFIRADDA